MIPKQLASSLSLENVWSKWDLQLSMRWTLFNWILDVASPDAMNLHHSCVWLCFSIVDNFIHLKGHIGKDQLQIIGITALFIAAKMNAVDVPSSHDFDFYTDDKFSKMDILRMEQRMMTTLQFQLFDPQLKITLLDQLHPHAHYLWELFLVGCESLNKFNYAHVLEFCKQMALALSNTESTRLTLTFTNDWIEMVTVLTETIHQEKTRIEKGKRSALQRKFSRPPFQNVALSVMVNLSRVKFAYTRKPVSFSQSVEYDEFNDDLVNDRTFLTQSGGVLTRAASKRLREAEPFNTISETQQYLIKKRKTLSVTRSISNRLRSHKKHVKSHNQSSGEDILAKITETKKRHLRRCQAQTKWGKQCTRKPRVGSRYCAKHISNK